eukprot:3881009-Rhodomonas_salina.2
MVRHGTSRETTVPSASFSAWPPQTVCQFRASGTSLGSAAYLDEVGRRRLAFTRRLPLDRDRRGRDVNEARVRGLGPPCGISGPDIA